MTLQVEQAALLMTIQDAGRFGYLRYGMPESGPMDWRAFLSANQLVGNGPNDACVEIGYSSTVLLMGADALLAVCGAGFRVWVNSREIPMWMAFAVQKGDRLSIKKDSVGSWAYLAVGGGIQTTVWLGSRSVYPLAGLGRKLAEGDQLPFNTLANSRRLLASCSIPLADRPPYQADPVIRVIPGPHQHRFTTKSVENFFNQPFTLSTNSDRMGFRLNGPALDHKDGADLVSQGMVLGEIQVPGDGQPIVMMPDHPTAGGYTSIATIIKADLPLLAQAQPEKSQIRFSPAAVSDAQESLIAAKPYSKSFIEPQEEQWMNL